MASLIAKNIYEYIPEIKEVEPEIIEPTVLVEEVIIDEPVSNPKVTTRNSKRK